MITKHKKGPKLSALLEKMQGDSEDDDNVISMEGERNDNITMDMTLHNDINLPIQNTFNFETSTNSPSHTNIATFISNSLDAEFDAAQYLYTDL